MEKAKKIVLVGASGFVGSAILNEATNRGFEVTAVVRRFLTVGGAGSLLIAPGMRLMDSGEVPGKILLAAVKSPGKFYMDFLRKEKEVDWGFFSLAADMRLGARTGRYRLGKDDMIVDIVGNSHISVENYATAMIDELEHPAHHQMRFSIGY